MLSASALSNIRVTVLGLTGLVCLLYAVLALLTGRPDPMSPWIPGLFGVGSAVVILGAFFAAAPRVVGMARDEGFFSDSNKAQRMGYWIALLLYPAFAVPLSNGWLTWPVAYAAMGTLTAAAYLLPFVWFDLRGR